MRDLSLERWLDKEQYAWEYRDKVPLSAIRWKANAPRLCRSFDKARVYEIFKKLVDGEAMPAVIVFDDGGHDLDLADGVHRIEAISDTDATETDVYAIMGASDYRRALLPELANCRNGRGPTLEERVQQAADKLARFPGTCSVEVMARQYDIHPANKLRDYIAIDRVVQHAIRLGIIEMFREQISISPKAVLAFGEIRNDNLFHAAVKLTTVYRMTVSEMMGVARVAASATTEAEGMRAIAAADEELAERDLRSKASTKKGRKMIPQRAFGLIKSFVNMGPTRRLALDGIDERDFDIKLTLVDEALELLRQVKAWMTKRKDERDKARAYREKRHGDETSESDSPGT